MGRNAKTATNSSEHEMKRVLITGSYGLVGSACVRRFQSLGWTVHGLDNNQRRQFFGSDGDTSETSSQLDQLENFTNHCRDIRDRTFMNSLIEECCPTVVIHCAAQPSHDFATEYPDVDFAVNAIGTMSLLEATRRHAPNAAFIFMSTNKVYGDRVNNVRFRESPTRWEMSGYFAQSGLDESVTIDQSRHSIFGASKAAADLMVQEYGRTYGMRTVCFRAGCLTGSDHAGAEQHGFLAYLAKCIKEGRPYRVYGYKGKQVRDQLHADDVATACEEFANDPKVAAVYNLGGGRENSISILEAIEWMERITGKRLNWSYVDEPRGGDHICYYTDTSKFRLDYPGWSVTRNLESIMKELCAEEVPA